MISIETNMLEKEMLLGMSKEMKLGLLGDANKAGEHGIVFQMMKILLRVSHNLILKLSSTLIITLTTTLCLQSITLLCLAGIMPKMPWQQPPLRNYFN